MSKRWRVRAHLLLLPDPSPVIEEDDVELDEYKKEGLPLWGHTMRSMAFGIWMLDRCRWECDERKVSALSGFIPMETRDLRCVRKSHQVPKRLSTRGWRAGKFDKYELQFERCLDRHI